jgi:hypothetical protein
MDLKLLNWDKIVDAYKEELIGKKFVYKSKYGGLTFGEVADVFTTTSIMWDSETTKLFAWAIQNAKMGKKKDNLSPKPERDPNIPKFSASNNKIQIKSINGNVYELNDLNFLSKEPEYGTL